MEVSMGFPTRPRVRFGEGDVYQLRIELEGLLPVVWRRVLVSGRASLHELHSVIQSVMDHDEELGYQVIVDGISFLDPEEDDHVSHRADTVSVATLGLHLGSRFRHIAEHHGDPWRHVVTVEQISPRLIGQRLPVCLAAGRASPPSDCASVEEYRELLAAVGQQGDVFAAAQLHWLPDNFDPEFVDVVALTAVLNRVPKRRPAA
jgi:hypothetical protein